MSEPKTRTARCNCGALTATTTGEPEAVAMCSCAACQRRTGSAFAYSSFWPVENVVLEGEPKVWSRTADSGHTIENFFCPTCGTTLYSRGRRKHLVNIAGGCFVDKDFPSPQRAVWNAERHDWIDHISGIPAEDKQPG